MIRLGAIADDFTGATDLATVLRERGLRVLVALGPDAVPSASPASSAQPDAIVVALKTRTVAPASAVEESVRALRALLPLRPQQVYVKYCSTFDSTPIGNIGPVLDAVLDELGADRAIVAPALPDNGRTVYRGRLFVGDDLLEESSMRHHPLTPMTRSRVSTLLAEQTSRSIAELTMDVVARGPEAVRAALDDGAAVYTVVDSISNDDLVTVQRAVADWPVISGGSGLAYGMSGPHDPASEPFPAPAGRRLVICGSASAQTRRQIAAAREVGAAMLQLDVPRVLAAPDEQVADAVAWLSGLGEEEIPVIYSVGELSDVRDNGDGSGPAERIEDVNARIALAAVRDAGVRRMIVAGGETSGAVATALGCRSLLVGPQIAAGVCWTASSAEAAGGKLLALALKSGNFGTDDMFSTGWDRIA